MLNKASLKKKKKVRRNTQIKTEFKIHRSKMNFVRTYLSVCPPSDSLRLRASSSAGQADP
jgi:hypothetical protein